MPFIAIRHTAVVIAVLLGDVGVSNLLYELQSRSFLCNPNGTGEFLPSTTLLDLFRFLFCIVFFFGFKLFAGWCVGNFRTTFRSVRQHAVAVAVAVAVARLSLSPNN